MARPRKCRRICGLPGNGLFGPLDKAEQGGEEQIVLALDEYETIRLIDLLGYTQEECAEQMGVARTTAQAVYNSARRKLAQFLTEGRGLLIQGGDYVLCPDSSDCCGKKCREGRGCPRRCGGCGQEPGKK